MTSGRGDSRIPPSHTRAAVYRHDELASSPQWRRIEHEFFSTARAEPVQTGLTALADAAVIESCEASFAGLSATALFAVGSYGRRELFPYSEIGLLLLHRTESAPELAEALTALTCSLRNAGWSVSVSSASVEEALRARLPIFEENAGLLDQRFLFGDPAIREEVAARMPGLLERHGAQFVRRLSRLARERHARFRNTPAHLEPDVNLAPGGWRDLELIARLAQLCAGRIGSAPVPEAAARFLASLRCFLHYHAGSDWNVLDADACEGILQPPFTHALRAEDWMREYFGHARAIFNRARQMLDTCGKNESALFQTYCDSRARLSNEEFTVSREFLFLRQPERLTTEPATGLRLWERVAHLGVAPAAASEKRLESAEKAFGDFCCQTPALWQELRAILRKPQADLALRGLHRLGMLASILPEWRAVDGLTVRDPEHRFTAEEHTLAAIECVCRLRRPIPGQAAKQRFADVLDEIDDPALLLFALLLHAAGKQETEDPAEWPWRSAACAREAARRLGMSQDDQNTAAFLIEQQLELAQIMGVRDTDDPVLARRLAAQVGTIEHLKMLTVLTYATVSATRPGAMTAWRAELLWRMFDAVSRELTVELETDRIEQRPGNLPQGAEFIRGFPVRYLRAHTDVEIAAHIQLHERSEPTGVAIQVERIEGAFRLTLIARDRPYLFAALAGAISSFRLNILKAEAFSNDAGQVLDTFVFAEPSRSLEMDAAETARLKDMIRKIALGKTDLRRMVHPVPAPESRRRSSHAGVRFDAEACDTATLVEIVGDDRPGLLASLAAVFSSAGCNIDVVLIDTKGGRAMDVFYVAHQGRKLSAEMQATLHQKLLAVC